MSWGEYFGFRAPTVTVTITDLHVSTVEDPSVVVTYAIKGCQPFSLAIDMNKCPPKLESSVSIEEILPTSTVVSPFEVGSETLLPTKTTNNIITSTLYGTFTNLNDNLFINTQPSLPSDNSNTLESSVQQLNTSSNTEPTEPLL